MLYLESWHLKKKSSQVMTVVLALAFPCLEFVTLAPI